jgi:hypothetical protein
LTRNDLVEVPLNSRFPETFIMTFPSKRLSLMALAGLIALSEGVFTTYAQQPVPPGQAAVPAVPGASIQSVPMFVPNQATSVYTPYLGINAYDPYGGYLNGASNVIGSQSQFMIAKQQANLMKQQEAQAKLQTRRATLDEHLYERAHPPTREDEAERARTEQLRFSRNDPPLTVIWSGEALNTLLLGIQRQLAQGIPSYDVPLLPEVVSHLNVTGGSTGGSLALLKHGGVLHWPLELQGETYKTDRQVLDQLVRQVYSEAASGAVDGKTLMQMTKAVNALRDKLRQQIAKIEPNAYIKANRFANELSELINVLQGPDVSKYATGQWQARGNTVAQLVQNLTSQGLRFAPAMPEDQSSYVATHRAMAAYYEGPNKQRPWDPLAK